MKPKCFMSVLLLMVLAVFGGPAYADMYGFQCITNSVAGDTA